jgi:sec-independent protein translocase protein TatC
MFPVKKFLNKSNEFIVLTPQEYFFTEIKISLLAGLFVSMPWILYQVWKFIAPGLYKSEKKYIFLLTLFSSFFFIFGGVFCYFLVLPKVFKFFIEILPLNIKGNYSFGMLYSFITNILLAFAIVFEAPIIVFFLIFFSIVDVSSFKQIRKYVIVGSFIIGALLTPPDPLTQIMLAIPLIILYELGIIMAKFAIKYKQ